MAQCSLIYVHCRCVPSDMRLTLGMYPQRDMTCQGCPSLHCRLLWKVGVGSMGTVEPSCEGTNMLMMLSGMIAFVRPACTCHQHHHGCMFPPSQ